MTRTPRLLMFEDNNHCFKINQQIISMTRTPRLLVFEDNNQAVLR